MQFTLQNKTARIVLDTHAAEIHSFQRKDKDFEYMWNGNPEYWAGRNPVLFPQVSSHDSKINIYKGKEYAMGNHGFARNSEFEPVSETEESLVLSLKDSEETLKQFPYHFELRVSYRLIDTSISITYAVLNNDEETMPFGFGLHPAFMCPIDPEKTMTDYYLLFSDEEDADFVRDRKTMLSRELFSEHRISLIRNHNSSYVTLSDGTNGVRVRTEGFRYLMFWSPKNAPFVCIEPWMFTQKKDGPVIPFEEKEGAIPLPPGETFRISTEYTLL